MKCLNDSGLKKLMIFLESRIPGISQLVEIDGNKLSIDKNIKLYAFVEEPVTEAVEVPLSPQEPLSPSIVAQQASKIPAAQEPSQTEKLRAIKVQKDIEELRRQQEELGEEQDDLSEKFKKKTDTAMPVTVQMPLSPEKKVLRRQQDIAQQRAYRDLAQQLKQEASPEVM